MKYTVEFTDNKTGATSPVDTIDALEGYTAADYLRDCRANADSAWCEMLEGGSVELFPVQD